MERVATGKLRLRSMVVYGFLIGALIPAFWGIMGMLLFNLKEGTSSRIFWRMIYVTCPFWAIHGAKAMLLMPLLNGFLYALLALGFGLLFLHFHRQ